MGKIRLVGIIAVMLMAVFLATSGKFMVVNDPRPADAILVLAGDAQARPARGLELLEQGYAPRLILDVPAEASIYQTSEIDLAERYIRSLPQAKAISVCPIHGLSTKAEAGDAEPCMQSLGAQKILLVTSDFHTRRALSIFRRCAPRHAYSIAASRDANEFEVHWWRRREWAKTNFDEWLRRLWWELVDQWH